MNNILPLTVNFSLTAKWIPKGNILTFNIFNFFYTSKNVNVFTDITSNRSEFLPGIPL